jgi:hypothetical protein
MALTWQNVSPSNPAGILQAGNMAAANIAKGLDTVGDSMRQYAGDTKDAETGKLLLMLDNAKDRNERQNVLDKFDMDYVDQDIIAKDNQRFEIGEERKAEALYSRGMQEKDAARDILGRKTTADFQQFQREDTAKKADLELGYRTADVKRDNIAAEKLENYQDKMYAAKLLAEKNAETKRSEDRLAKIAATEATTLFRKGVISREEAQAVRQKAEHGIKIEELKKNQENIKKGEILTGEAGPKIREANDINGLVNLRKDYRDARLKQIPGAQGIIDAINVKIAKVLDLPSLYGDDITMTIEGKTQADKVRKHSSNLQKTVSRLKTILPGSTSAELQTMAENILRRSSPEYEDGMSKLKITSKEFNANYLLNFRGDLRTYTDDEDGLTNADIVDLRERFTGKKTQITPENAEAIETITGILDSRYKENFNKTPLGTLLSNVDAGELKANMEIASVAGEVDGVIDKERVTAKHNANVQNLVNALRPIGDYADKLTNDEMKKKVTEELLRDPAYANIVNKAGISYIEDMKRDKSQAVIRFNTKIGKAKTAKDFSGIIDFAITNGILDETNASLFTTKISERALKDEEIINTQINIDPATFTYDGWEKWERQARFEIKEKWERIPESAVDKMIDSIVNNNKPLKTAITSYENLQAYKANLQAEMNVLTTAQKISDAKFNTQFKEAPIQTLTSHILSKPTRKLVLESLKSAEQTEDLQDTISNAWEVTNYVYGILKDGYPKDTPEQLGKRSKRVLDTLVPENEIFGKEFTITDWAGDHNLKKEDILRAGKETNRASDF